MRLVILYCTFDFYAMYAILQYFCKKKICTISYFSWDNCRVFLAILISHFCFGCVVDGVFEGHVLKLLLCFLLFSMVAKLIEPCNPLVMVVVDFPWNLFINLLNLYPCFITTLHNLQEQQNRPQIATSIISIVKYYGGSLYSFVQLIYLYFSPLKVRL